jgi:alkylhydroperoxidase/carboxymuconolactone decarboxylase family protein YurZ
MAERVGPIFAEEAFMSAGGPAWSQPVLTARERSIAIITALAAQGVAGDHLDSHIRLAQRDGLGYEALTAMMTLVTNYIGQACGSQAMEAVQRVAAQPRQRRALTAQLDPVLAWDAASATTGRRALPTACYRTAQEPSFQLKTSPGNTDVLPLT